MAVRKDGSGRPSGTGLRCARFAAAAATRVCLTPDAGPLRHGDAVVLDARLHELRRYPLAGVASRAQVSRSGRMISWTVFVTGDSYAGAAFSTWTSILDTRTGEYLANIESLPVTVGARRYYAPDVNIWGVTFAADDDRFYATLGSRGHTWLLEASMGDWAGHALRDGVECPSLSPDGARLAFKKRIAPGRWLPAVLTLRTGRVVELSRSTMDDQAVWLDDATVAWATHGDVWSAPADGSRRAAVLLRAASSPAPA
jgi:hypothetical protein